jgi:1L-myo-inositol 1-phosphate cytidylyltransferase
MRNTIPHPNSVGRIKEAVILMAGEGSRLRVTGETSPKPLIDICGRPLFSYTIDWLQNIGIKIVHVVTGYESDKVLAGLKSLFPPGMKLHPIHNRDWRKQNGISLLAASGQVATPFLLTMGDHLFEPAIVDFIIERAHLPDLNLVVDRKLDSIFDLDDAMKAQTRSNRVVAIGKNLVEYDAIDTGLFLCPDAIFKYLIAAKRDGDCSLADGVRLMAADGKVRAIDIGDAWWQDVDSAETLEHARKLIATKRSSN